MVGNDDKLKSKPDEPKTTEIAEDSKT
jgi:hypothetical protein